MYIEIQINVEKKLKLKIFNYEIVNFFLLRYNFIKYIWNHRRYCV